MCNISLHKQHHKKKNCYMLFKTQRKKYEEVPKLFFFFLLPSSCYGRQHTPYEASLECKIIYTFIFIVSFHTSGCKEYTVMNSYSIFIYTQHYAHHLFLIYIFQVLHSHVQRKAFEDWWIIVGCLSYPLPWAKGLYLTIIHFVLLRPGPGIFQEFSIMPP